MNKTPLSANRQIARAAGTVMFAIVLGQIAGLIRGILVADAFPATELDAFFAANRVSETLFTLLAAGALGSAFIPTFTGLLAKDDKTTAWKLASSIANLLILTLSFLAVLAAIFAPQIVRYALAPGFSDAPALFSLTVNLLRIQLVSAVLFGIGGLIVGILNAHQVFLIPALTPSMYQLGMIFGVLVLAPGMGIYGLAWGVVVGAVLYLLLQIPSLLKQKITYSPVLGLDNSAVREVFRLMGPRVLGAAVVQLNFWVNTWLASQMVYGSVAGLQYGFSTMLMAQAAIAQSVAIAAMPTFSIQFALGKLDEMRTSLASSIRGVIFLALPASVGLILLRKPIITMLYQRGEFDVRMTELVTWALLWYAAGMIGHSVMEILTRAFYAQHDTKTPVIVGAIAMGLNVVFSFAFSSLFENIGWMPHGGLALANTVATALEVTVLLIIMRKRLNGLNDLHILRGGLQSISGTLAMSFAVLLCLRLLSDRSAGFLSISGIAAGGLVYALTMMVLRVPEWNTLVSVIRRRIS
ncbi:MAG: murein biosynthesis integral membrane protein MurJ [Anaerolineales bacterium]